MMGKVFLVGAGPGDPELLTVKALRLLQSADAVLHDELVAPGILRHVNPGAWVKNVGKRCGSKRVTQEEINFLMVSLAAAGQQVVRLKGGDPLIFGRAREEITALRRARIPFEIVPGISAALGAAAALQTPFTARRGPAAVVLLTGHRENDERSDWRELARSGATLVLYMPGRNYGEISRRLRRAGMDGQTPCAIVSRATTPGERVHVTTVAELAAAPVLEAPALLIVGEVVRQAAGHLSFASLPPNSALQFHAESLRKEVTP